MYMAGVPAAQYRRVTRFAIKSAALRHFDAMRTAADAMLLTIFLSLIRFISSFRYDII